MNEPSGKRDLWPAAQTDAAWSTEDPSLLSPAKLHTYKQKMVVVSHSFWRDLKRGAYNLQSIVIPLTHLGALFLPLSAESIGLFPSPYPHLAGHLIVSLSITSLAN